MRLETDLVARVEALEREVAELKAQLEARPPRAARERRQAAPKRPQGTPGQVLAALKEMGGYAKVSQLHKKLPGVPYSSLCRTCTELRDAGKLVHIAYGMYQLPEV